MRLPRAGSVRHVVAAPPRTPTRLNWRSVSAMTNLRQLIAWLLLALVAVVGAGAAALGVPQAPNNVPLSQAVVNTLAAPNYSEVVSEPTPQGTQADYLVYQAPDNLGGYIQSGNKRTYVYVIGDQGVPEHHRDRNHPHQAPGFLRQPSQGAAALDPAHNYLSYATAGQERQAVGVHLHIQPDPGRTGRDLRLHRVGEVHLGDDPHREDRVGPADHLARSERRHRSRSPPGRRSSPPRPARALRPADPGI